ncbi:dihydroneopterin aldolase [Paracoccus sp. 11-3]|uniref:dihydroneopterin aldolase n=2 Tax=Paracoccus amoyensis TaxID=2760093 RepID=A0A926GEE9_9RHOB|nr:dihydroneopterin aldolase [Paracoccus amoyensis]
MEKPDRIHLKDLIIAAEIGAFQSERGHPQRLRFNMTVDLRDRVSNTEDHVDHILSYDVLTQAIDTALADQRYNLVETLAEKIAAEVLAHRQAARIEVSVEKLDRGPGALGVTISRSASSIQASQAVTPFRVIVGQPATMPDNAAVILPATLGLPLPTGGDQRRITLLALDQAAWALAGRMGLEVAETRTELDAAIRSERAVVWAPTRLTADAPEAGQQPATLGLWLARRLGAHRIDFAGTKAAPAPIPDDFQIAIGHID